MSHYDDHRTFWVEGAPAPDDPSDTRGLRQTILAAIPGADIASLRTLGEGFESDGPEVHSRGEFSYEIIVRKRER